MTWYSMMVVRHSIFSGTRHLVLLYSLLATCCLFSIEPLYLLYFPAFYCLELSTDFNQPLVFPLGNKEITTKVLEKMQTMVFV